MSKTVKKLVIVMDAAHCRLFEAVGHSIVNELQHITSESCIPIHERPEKHDGYYHRASAQSHFFDPHNEPKDLDRHEFAKKLVDILVDLLQLYSGLPLKYQAIILAAEPKMLGHFRECALSKIQDLVVEEVPKDLVKEEMATIEKIIFA